MCVRECVCERGRERERERERVRGNVEPHGNKTKIQKSALMSLAMKVESMTEILPAN